MKKIAILMGSRSDLEAVKPAYDVIREFGVECDMRIISAHRTPEICEEFSRKAVKNGYGVIIAAAGKAAHLGGVIAAFTSLPVLGIPIKSSTMDGMDSLLSMVQMPSGVPVACVGINGALNAGLYAVQMLGIRDKELNKKMLIYKQNMADKVASEDNKLQQELKSNK